MTMPKILYVLKCQHVMPGTIGNSTLKCLNCETDQSVERVHTWEWVASCKSCTSRTWCGLAKLLAEFHANKHAQAHPDHEARVLYQENPYAVKVQRKYGGRQ